MREDLIYFSDEEMEEMISMGLAKKERLVWEINGDKYILNRATNDGYWFNKIKNKPKVDNNQK